MSVARNEAEIYEAIDGAGTDLGFTGTACAFHQPEPSLATDHNFSSVWPNEVHREWIRKGFHLRNPINTAIQNLQRTAVWNTKDYAGVDPKYLDAYDFASTTCARSGCMVTPSSRFAGPAFLLFSLDAFETIDPIIVEAVEVIASAAALNISYLRNSVAHPEENLPS